MSQEAIEITKSLEFSQGQLDQELEKMKSDNGKLQADIKDLDEDLLDPDFITKKLI